jgi:hypothetical protein
VVFRAAACSVVQAKLVAAPTISFLSPASGRARGANTVTVRRTNFVGVTAVHFGHKLATGLRILSPTQITVTAPRGSGTVTVTVSAAGGTSAATPSARYR